MEDQVISLQVCTWSPHFNTEEDSEE